MGLRAALNTWFDENKIHPRVIGEFEDSALMGVCAAGGRGFTIVHTVVERVALRHYGLKRIGRARDCGNEFYAITADRKLKHPGVMAITKHAYSEIFGPKKV